MVSLLQPATLILALLVPLVHVLLMLKGCRLSSLGYNYQSVVERGQAWRLATAGLCHLDERWWWIGVVHVSVNWAAIVLLGAVEAELGTITYVKGLVISLVGASACALLLCRGATRMSRLVGGFRRIAALARAAWWASGLSAGLLGLSMVLAIRLGELRMFGTSIPTYPMPYFYLVLVFWFMPRGNVVPTLLAMPIGVLFAGGAFVWVSNYLFFSMLGWAMVGVLISLKLNSNIPLGFIRIDDSGQWTELTERPVRTFMVDGRVRFDEGLDPDGLGADVGDYLADDEDIELQDDEEAGLIGAGRWG